MRLYLVRHAEVVVRPSLPASQWLLSATGVAAAGALAAKEWWAELDGLYASPEPKALGTAEPVAARHGLPISPEPRLREVERTGWAGEQHGELARRYLEGEAVDGWERREAALSRVRGCIDGVAAKHRGSSAGVVSHGLALTLYLAGLLGLDAYAAHELWARMRFPDVAIVDPQTGHVFREFGQDDDVLV